MQVGPRNSRRGISIAGLTIAVLQLAGCGGTPTGGGGGDPTEPASITMTTDRTTRARNESFTLAPEVRNADNEVITAEVTFTTSSAAVAEVSTTGVVTTKNTGQTTLRATAGSVSAEVQITVVAGTLVGPAGGNITVGSVALTVPAGALTSETVITLGSISAPILDPTGVNSTNYAIGPTSLTFAVPATLALTVPNSGGPLGLPIEQFGIRRLASTAWVNGDQPTIDVATRRATIKVNGAGQFSAGRMIPTQPCTAPEYRQFDYWVKPWRVSVGGQAVANSDITAEAGGCAIFEKFTPFGGGTGRSISFYVPATQKWYQTYVDDAGFRLLLAGTIDGQGQMTMYTNQGGQQTERWAWLKEGSNVRQRADFTNDGGNSYQAPHFNGLYVPR